MTANILRTPAPMRPFVEDGLGGYLEAVCRILGEPIRSGLRGRRRARVDAGLRAAVDFHLWRRLAPLGDAEAAELGAGLVELAAGVTDSAEAVGQTVSTVSPT